MPTTDFRPYYLEQAASEQRADRIEAAEKGWQRWLAWPHRRSAEEALKATKVAAG